MESIIDISAKEWLISEYNNYIINLSENGFKCKFCMTFINESYLEIVKHIHIKHFRDSFLIRFPKYRQLIKKINEQKLSNDENNGSENNNNNLSDKSEDQINSNDNNLSNNSIERQESNDNNNGINDKIEENLNSEKRSQYKSQSNSNKTDIIRDQINAYFNKVSKSGSKSKNKKKKKLLKEIVGKKVETVNRIGFIKRIIRDNKHYYQCCWSGCQYESQTIDKCLLDHIKRHQKCDDLDIKKVKQSVQKKLNSISGKKSDSDQIKGALNEVKIVKLMVRSDAKNSIIFND
jgi:hypothetical protein